MNICEQEDRQCNCLFRMFTAPPSGPLTMGGLYFPPHGHQAWPRDLLWPMGCEQKHMPVLSRSLESRLLSLTLYLPPATRTAPPRGGQILQPESQSEEGMDGAESRPAP